MSFQGLAYDHVELNFYLNGKPLSCPMMGIKGTVYPVFYGKDFNFTVNHLIFMRVLLL